MTDLRTLLHDAAPRPRHPLDLEAVARRVRRGRAKRIGLWLGAVGVAVGLGLPGGAVLVTTGDDSGGASPMPESAADAQRTPDASGLQREEGLPSPAASPSGASTAVGAGAPQGRGDSRSGPDGSASPVTGLPPKTTTTTQVEHPQARSCSVDNRGLEDGGRRSCRFTATAAGGISGGVSGDPPPGQPEPERRVTVTRGGQSRVYVVSDLAVFAGNEGVGCDNASIEPGDLVLVELVNPPTGTGAVIRSVGAGAGWGCY